MTSWNDLKQENTILRVALLMLTWLRGILTTPGPCTTL